MGDLIVVTKAQYLGGQTLTVTFSDGLQADIDFKPWIDKYPFFEPLKDLAYFKNFSLDGWTVVWPNGADIAPETLYSIALRSSEIKAA